VSQRITVIDTHTAGEPTRVVVEGGPDLGDGPLSHRRDRFRQTFDRYRSAVVNEPRGSDVMVGAWLVPPPEPDCCAGVIFFNNVGTLNMCGHGTIGVAVAMGHLGRIRAGRHRLATPVGTIEFDYDGANGVAFDNVPSYRHAAGVVIDVPGHGAVRGDVAWGGNWFFLTDDHGQELAFSNIGTLTDFSWRVRRALSAAGVTGRDAGEIDHVELVGPSAGHADARNFVLCPGGAYDRSPCGTGTSAKLACLYADGKLRPGQLWRQESIIGSVFEGSVREGDGAVIPRIAGSAYVTAQTTLILDDRDPFCWGVGR
jgi:4-hydroxyproline epimerase